MKCLIQKAVGKDECIVHVLPCFERIGKSDFNEKVYKFNGAVEELCESQSKVHLNEALHVTNALLNRFICKIIIPYSKHNIEHYFYLRA
jgi:hypothetical protein